jgi:hypothetical protein
VRQRRGFFQVISSSSPSSYPAVVINVIIVGTGRWGRFFAHSSSSSRGGGEGYSFPLG